MNLWRLEVLRLFRTKRWLALAGVFVFFGLVGPIVAKYIDQIVQSNIPEGVVFDFPDPVPADGLRQYVDSALQIGLLVALIVSAGGLAFDSSPEISTFLRTRTSVARILVPRYVVAALAAAVAWFLGGLAAAYETSVLIGAPPLLRTLGGLAFGGLFFAFAVAVTCLTATLIRSTAGAAFLAVFVVATLALVGPFLPFDDWVPTHLTAAVDGLVLGRGPGEYRKATLMTVALIPLLVWGATRIAARREI